MYDSYATSGNKFFVPTVWAASIVHKSRRDGRIKFDDASNQIVKVLYEYSVLSGLGILAFRFSVLSVFL